MLSLLWVLEDLYHVVQLFIRGPRKVWQLVDVNGDLLALGDLARYSRLLLLLDDVFPDRVHQRLPVWLLAAARLLEWLEGRLEAVLLVTPGLEVVRVVDGNVVESRCHRFRPQALVVVVRRHPLAAIGGVNDDRLLSVWLRLR